MKKTILIYRDQLLPYSETFIPAQVDNFSEYSGYYIGSSRLPNSELIIPRNRSIIIDDVLAFPSIWKTAYKLFNITNPHWIKQIKELKPALIHAHFGLDGVLALPLAKQLNIPLIVTFHGYYATANLGEIVNKNGLKYGQDYLSRRGQFFRELYLRKRAQLFDEADCFIAVSEFIKNKLMAQGCPEAKIKVHYIGIDVEKFTPDANMECQNIVLFVGRLVEKKGCEYLIKAIAQVQKTNPELELVIIGDGILRQKLEKLAANSLNKYRFLGVQPPEAVKTWLNQAKMLVAPSITTDQGETEGLPIVILEAMAMGLPVISTIHAGIPEAVKHEETGFLIPEKDTETMAKYIIQLYQDSKLRKELGIAGQNRIKRDFNLKMNTIKLENIYHQI